MHFTSLAMLAIGLAPALVSSAPSQGLSLRQANPTTYMLFVTLWQGGCDKDDEPENDKSTYQFHDKGEEIPGDPVGECLDVIGFAWQSMRVAQPTDGKCIHLLCTS